MCGTEPIQLSKDLWGYLNLALTGKQKLTFNNVPQGNGFEAWRRLVVPIVPRSDARLHDMQGDINVPSKSKRLTDVMEDIDTWEGLLLEYHKCGGDPMSDKTKIIVCLKMLPQTTPSSLKMALKGIKDFEVFKDELRTNIKYLQDFGGLASAHMIGEDGAPNPMGPSIGAWHEDEQADETETQVGEGDIPAFVLQNLTGHERDGLVAAINRSMSQKKPNWRSSGGPQRNGPPGPRAPAPSREGYRSPAPPRDARDIKCANCGAAGHTAQLCKKPKVPFEERKCHGCGKTGHIASKCPEKAGKANMAEGVSGPTAQRVLVVESEGEYIPVQRRRPTPQPLTMGDPSRCQDQPSGQKAAEARGEQIQRSQRGPACWQLV